MGRGVMAWTGKGEEGQEKRSDGIVVVLGGRNKGSRTTPNDTEMSASGQWLNGIGGKEKGRAKDIVVVVWGEEIEEEHQMTQR